LEQYRQRGKSAEDWWRFNKNKATKDDPEGKKALEIKDLLRPFDKGYSVDLWRWLPLPPMPEGNANDVRIMIVQQRPRTR
jgi:hypothetical protein